jgi:hypothetical protein
MPPIQQLGVVWRRRLATTSGAVLLGLVALAFAQVADYAQDAFGAMRDVLTFKAGLVACPVAGVLGSLCGGLFSRMILFFGSSARRPIALLRSRPVLWALACGLAVAAMGVLSAGVTWGAGYGAARSLVFHETYLS